MVDSVGYTTSNFLEAHPLHLAIQQGNDQILSHLIDTGESVNASTFDSVTPLHDACLIGNLKCVQILLAAGACIEARNVDGATPLCDASNNGNVECVRLLLEHGAEVNPPLSLTTPLHEAVLRCHVVVVEILINAGAQLEASDLHFGTPLHIAAFKDHLGCAQVLLNGGANSNAAKMHQTTLHIAAKNQSSHMITLLLEYGAHVYAQNNWGIFASNLAIHGSEAHAVLKYWESNPRSLKHLCRLHIRKQLGPSRLKYLNVMLLPFYLRDFLQYKF